MKKVLAIISQKEALDHIQAKAKGREEIILRRKSDNMTTLNTDEIYDQLIDLIGQINEKLILAKIQPVDPMDFITDILDRIEKQPKVGEAE